MTFQEKKRKVRQNQSSRKERLHGYRNLDKLEKKMPGRRNEHGLAFLGGEVTRVLFQ